MITANDFHVTRTTLAYKKDEYPLERIKAARVKTNTLKDHLLRVIAIGLVVASVVWMICPAVFGLFTAPVAISVGALVALSTARRYELQVEFEHADETGLQWVCIAKTNREAAKTLFEREAGNINSAVA